MGSPGQLSREFLGGRVVRPAGFFNELYQQAGLFGVSKEVLAGEYVGFFDRRAARCPRTASVPTWPQPRRWH